MKKRMTVSQLRNLPQYRDLTDEELEGVRTEIIEGSTKSRTEQVLETFEQDYDLSEMNANDALALHDLAQIYVRLEDLEKKIDDEMFDGEVAVVEKLTRVSNMLRRDASQIQQDLAITRKIRRGDKEENLVVYIEDLKQRAKKFLGDRLAYVYCPDCRMLVANVWFLYPEEDNVLSIRCGRILDADTGKMCNHEFKVTSKFLKENNNTNLKDTLPV